MLPIILAIRDEDDREFVSAIYEKYGKKIYCVAKSHLHNDFDSEDCVQDTFVVLIDKLEWFRTLSESHQKNFLVKVCRCIAINKYKENMERLSTETELDDSVEDEGQRVDADILSRESYNELVSIIDGMDPKYGDILYLKGFMNMTNTEISRMLDISTDLVAVRLLRARKMIKDAGWGI